MLNSIKFKKSEVFNLKFKNVKVKICSGALASLMVVQLCFFCPCTYAAHNRLMEVLKDSENLTVEDIKPIVEANPVFVKETYSGKNKKRKTVLYYALCKEENTPENRTAIAVYLIEKGAGVGSMWKGGDTPLHWAAAYGQDVFVQFLLEKGSDPNKVNGDGETPLQLAKNNNHASTIKLLEPNNADTSAVKPEVAVPVPAAVPECDMTTKGTIDDLCAAAETGNLDKVRALLESGIDPNKTDKYGSTPLHVAAKGGCEDCVRLLLEKGADPNGTVFLGDLCSGLTPLHCATQEGHEACAKLLLEKGSNPNAAFSSDENSGMTPLHLAAANGDEACVRLLLEKGSNLNADASFGGKSGMTPLLCALFLGNEACVRLLLEKGADPNPAVSCIEPCSGATPLDLATIDGHGACVRLVLDKLNSSKL